MIIYPDIDRVAFSLGPLKVHWYGLTYLAGFVLSFFFARHRAKRADAPIEPKDVEDLIFYGALGVILGGRLGYLIFYGWTEVLKDPTYIFKFWEGGMSFHGGLLGVLVAMALFARKHDRGFFEITDFVAVFTPLGLFCGRIGNFINGELWGGPTDLPWGFLHEGVVKHPSMLYEALFEGVILFVLLAWFSRKPRPTRAVSGLFLLGYGVFRSGIEFVRLPDGHIGYLADGWFTMGQLLCLPMIAYGLYLIWCAYRTPQTAVAS
ncbi:MAG: prolipoprotein diacylglyceryl transferase [Pseudomonadota bacterium]